MQPSTRRIEVLKMPRETTLDAIVLTMPWFSNNDQIEFDVFTPHEGSFINEQNTPTLRLKNSDQNIKTKRTQNRIATKNSEYYDPEITIVRGNQTTKNNILKPSINKNTKFKPKKVAETGRGISSGAYSSMSQYSREMSGRNHSFTHTLKEQSTGIHSYNCSPKDFNQTQNIYDKNTNESQFESLSKLQEKSDEKQINFLTDKITQLKQLLNTRDSEIGNLKAKLSKYDKHNESIDTTTFRINELMAQVDSEKEKHKYYQERTKVLLEYINSKQHLDLKEMEGNTNPGQKRAHTRRVSSVIQSNNSLNDSRSGSKAIRAKYNWSERKSSHCRPTHSNNRSLSMYTSPKQNYPGYSSYLNYNPATAKVVDEASEYIELRRDLKRETELVVKLKKLMMDTSHPCLF